MCLLYATCISACKIQKPMSLQKSRARMQKPVESKERAVQPLLAQLSNLHIAPDLCSAQCIGKQDTEHQGVLSTPRPQRLLRRAHALQ